MCRSLPPPSVIAGVSHIRNITKHNASDFDWLHIAKRRLADEVLHPFFGSLTSDLKSACFKRREVNVFEKFIDLPVGIRKHLENFRGHFLNKHNDISFL